MRSSLRNSGGNKRQKMSPYEGKHATAKALTSVVMPNYIGNHRTNNQWSRLSSNSRSKSRSQSNNKVSNHKDYQVVSDEKGINRKIEYYDDESPPRHDDLQYSKSELRPAQNFRQSSKHTPTDTPNFQEDMRPMKLDELQKRYQQTTSRQRKADDMAVSPEPNSEKYLGSQLQQSSSSTAINRSVQMRATNERLAKLEQMYE